MLRLIKKTEQADEVTTTVTLPLDKRIKCRLRIDLDNGEEAGIFLDRGETTKDGDLLIAETGEVVRVVAANEPLSVIRSDDPLLLARACYHLGNRHMSLQIERDKVSFMHDHVLDDMLRGLGLEVSFEEAPFEPEPGAYGGSAEAGHSASHGHSHGHGHHHHEH